ncbi:MAG: type II secretion system protein [Patescibacteria group bacterium]
MKITGKKPAGFTLMELIIVIGFFAFISAIIMQNLFAVYHFKEVIRYKKDINFEASSVLNNGMAGIIRSGFAINYAETQIDNSVQPTEGMQSKTDQISIFTDRAETQYFTIYRAPYSEAGNYDGDVAQMMIRFSNGETFPLHSSETVVEDFDVIVPSDPRSAGDPDLQPYVTLYLRVRHRYPFGEAAAEETQMAYRNVRASYRTTYSLRNTVPSSYKTPSET